MSRKEIDRLARIKAVIREIEEIKGAKEAAPTYTAFFPTVADCTKETWWYTVIANKFSEMIAEMPKGSTLITYNVDVFNDDNTDMVNISAGDPEGIDKGKWFGYNAETGVEALGEMFNRYKHATINIVLLNNEKSFNRVINMEWANKDESDTEPTVQNTEVQ